MLLIIGARAGRAEETPRQKQQPVSQAGRRGVAPPNCLPTRDPWPFSGSFLPGSQEGCSSVGEAIEPLLIWIDSLTGVHGVFICASGVRGSADLSRGWEGKVDGQSYNVDGTDPARFQCYMMCILCFYLIFSVFASIEGTCARFLEFYAGRFLRTSVDVRAPYPPRAPLGGD